MDSTLFKGEGRKLLRTHANSEPLAEHEVPVDFALGTRKVERTISPLPAANVAERPMSNSHSTMSAGRKIIHTAKVPTG
jgi:hypothetical protein